MCQECQVRGEAGTPGSNCNFEWCDPMYLFFIFVLTTLSQAWYGESIQIKREKLERVLEFQLVLNKHVQHQLNLNNSSRLPSQVLTLGVLRRVYSSRECDSQLRKEIGDIRGFSCLRKETDLPQSWVKTFKKTILHAVGPNYYISSSLK